jgi:tetratricopeptide (TPR) repeat protein
MEQEVISELNNIKLLLYISLTMSIIFTISVIYLVIQLGKRYSEKIEKDLFNDNGYEMLDKECYEELIEHSNDMLKDRPNHAYALWFLGKSYYSLEKYDLAKVQFEKILKNEPSWKESVEPYLDEIESLTNPRSEQGDTCDN